MKLKTLAYLERLKLYNNKYLFFNQNYELGLMTNGPGYPYFNLLTSRHIKKMFS